MGKLKVDPLGKLKNPGIFAVSCVMAYRHVVGIFNYIWFLHMYDNRYIREIFIRRTVVSLGKLGVR